MPKYFWVYAFDVLNGKPQDVRGGELSSSLQQTPLKNPPVHPSSAGDPPPADRFGVLGVDAKDQNTTSIHFINGLAFSATNDEAALALINALPSDDPHRALRAACSNCVLYEVK